MTTKTTSTSSQKQGQKSSASRSSGKSGKTASSKPKGQTNVREETHVVPNPKSRKLTAGEAKQIDGDPGYSAEQLDQMSEYYGETANAQTSGDVAVITPYHHLAGQKPKAEREEAEATVPGDKL